MGKIGGKAKPQTFDVTSTREMEDVHQIKRHRKEGGMIDIGAGLSIGEDCDIRFITETRIDRGMKRSNSRALSERAGHDR